MGSTYKKKFSFAILKKSLLMGGLLCPCLAPGIFADSQGRRLDLLFLDIWGLNKGTDFSPLVLL